MSFDPNAFANMEFTGEVGNQVKLVGVDPGEYVMVAESFEPVLVQTKNGEQLKITWSFTIQDNDGRAEAATGLKKNTVRWQVWVDRKPDGSWDDGKNKNIWLGQFKVATGVPLGQKFSLQDFLGKPVTGEVTHRADPKDASNVYIEVKRVRPV